MQPSEPVMRTANELLAGEQNAECFMSMHGLLQACLLSATLHLGNSNARPPHPDALLVEAADIRLAAGAMATFLEALAERIRAASARDDRDGPTPG
jgi:hypothetical protein